MGRDKALVVVDGIAMAARVQAALLAGGCSPVIAVGGDQTALVALGFEVVPDEFPGEGPLGGIITALAAHHTAQAVMVAACDHPHLSVGTVQALVQGLGAADVAVACGDRLQPVCAVWKPRTAATLRHLFATGERRLLSVLSVLQVVEVRVDPQDLANVNTPSDLPQ